MRMTRFARNTFAKNKFAMSQLAVAIMVGTFASAAQVWADEANPGMHDGMMGMSGNKGECKKKDFEERLAALEAKADQPPQSKWTWNATLEVESSWNQDYAGEHTSDIVLSTAYLRVEGEISPRVTGFMSFLYEQDDTPLDIDEGYLEFSANDALAFRLGQEYVPFGVYETHLINDPITLSLGEAVETVAQATYKQNGFLASAYVYNGDAPYAEEERAEDAGARLQYVLGEEATGKFLVDLDINSNIADSDTLQDYFSSNSVILGDKHKGYAASVSYKTGAWGANIEQVAVVDAFKATEFAFVGEESKPKATTLETWVSTEALLPSSTVALAFHRTSDALLLEMPENRVALGLIQSLDKGTWGWGVEAWRDQDYAEKDGGSDEKAWGLVVQVSANL